jgi:HK97 family phage major capsid protein
VDLHQEFIQAIEDGNKVIFDLKNRVDHLETKDAKANRPHFGGGGEDFSLDATAHKAAFRKYLCKGESQGLSELQSKAMSVGSGNDGGYTVPKIIDSMLENLAVNISPIRAISTVVQCSTQDYHKLVNLRGTQSGWVGESESRPLTNTPQLADIAPPFGEIFCNLSATQQMLDDSFFNAEQWLAENAATEFARAEGQAMVSGNGINQPVGFLFKPTSATPDGVRAFGTLEHVATGVSGAFKTLTSTVNPVDDLFTLVGKLKAEYRKDACFVMNKATLFQVTSFKDYQGRYVFNPTTAPGQPDTLLGYPIYEAEDMPGIAANSASIAFGNFKRGYLVVDRIGTRVLRDPFSAKPAVTFYITKRLAGCIQNSECIKILKFSTT